MCTRLNVCESFYSVDIFIFVDKLCAKILYGYGYRSNFPQTTANSTNKSTCENYIKNNTLSIKHFMMINFVP